MVQHLGKQMHLLSSVSLDEEVYEPTVIVLYDKYEATTNLTCIKIENIIGQRGELQII